jgi:hypothetical protein
MGIDIGRWIVAALALAATAAHASYHLFQIDEIFSNADGTVQYVVLLETTGSNNENLLGNKALTSTSTVGVVKNFTFPANLPSTATSRKRVLIATPGFAALGLVTPDYTIPTRFIPTDGGTLDYALVHTVGFQALPIDGVTALKADGSKAQGNPRNFAGASATMTASPVGNIEFYNAALDHYYISALAPDIDALDTGRFVGWARTGQGFRVYPSQAAGGAGVNPVCRIRIPPALGDSHFYSAQPQECADTIAKFPLMTQESPNVFYIALPSTSGAGAGTCPGGTVPVYRVYDNRADANHRYTTSRAIRDDMVARGYIAEGYGDDAVIMCAPAGAVAASSEEPPGMPGPMPPEIESAAHFHAH